MNYPVLIYDNICTSCTGYAKYVNILVDGKITMLGHYTPQGKKFKKQIFSDGYEGLDMSWFVTPTTAYGGREGLIQLLRYIFSLCNLIADSKTYPENKFNLTECTTDCRTGKGVMIRSCSILTEGKVIKYVS